MLIKEREMFVKEGMIFINRRRPIGVSRIIGGGEPLKTCNEVMSWGQELLDTLAAHTPHRRIE